MNLFKEFEYNSLINGECWKCFGKGEIGLHYKYTCSYCNGSKLSEICSECNGFCYVHEKCVEWTFVIMRSIVVSEEEYMKLDLENLKRIQKHNSEIYNVKSGNEHIYKQVSLSKRRKRIIEKMSKRIGLNPSLCRKCLGMGFVCVKAENSEKINIMSFI